MKQIKALFAVIMAFIVVLGLSVFTARLLFPVESDISDDAEVQYTMGGISEGILGDPGATEVYMNKDGLGYNVYVYKNADGTVIATNG